MNAIEGTVRSGDFSEILRKSENTRMSKECRADVEGSSSQGSSTVLLIQRMLSQLNGFSVPSNNLA